ncbi:MAG: hypothetical protein WC942_01860 [Clostridia bacterium]|jgi:hypothetical protein
MSHVATIETELYDIDALRRFLESDEIRSKGLILKQNSQIRYFYNDDTTTYDYVIYDTNGQADIGLRVNSDGKISIHGDWMYPSLFRNFNAAPGNTKMLTKKLLQGQNEYIFRRWCQKKRYKIVQRITEDGKTIIEAQA